MQKSQIMLLYRRCRSQKEVKPNLHNEAGGSLSFQREPPASFTQCSPIQSWDLQPVRDTRERLGFLCLARSSFAATYSGNAATLWSGELVSRWRQRYYCVRKVTKVIFHSLFPLSHTKLTGILTQKRVNKWQK